MLSFADYSALIAAFILAARQANDAAAPKTILAAAAIEANAACTVIEYAALNSRHSAADLPSLGKISASGKTLSRETSAGTANAACGASARSQNALVVKQNEKEQA
jgi:hypothetical protein